MKREEFLKSVLDLNFDEELLKDISPEEKRAIRAYAEDIMSNFYKEVFKPISDAIEADPGGLKKACNEIENELFISGSLDKK